MNIYVGNISYKSTVDDLGNLFAEYGDVTSVKIIEDKFTGRSKGFGFVEMGDEGGQAAVEALDGFDHLGRNLRVSKANPREENSNEGN
jgi:RNA recognition motif-containing protein